jgi:hypothetical protein
VREIQKDRDSKTGAQIIKSVAEYYIYNDRGTATQSFTSSTNQGLRIAPESIINVNSGLMDAKNTFVISYLHKAIKALNQLRMIEDAVVIYRLSRAPERRIFYIDVGNLPKGKAEQYMRSIMTQYRNKLVYDANTGEIRDERKHLSMLEDFWLPRREGGKGTEFNKFINRLRNKFSRIFDDALRVQLALKGICTTEEWDDFKEAIYYDFKKDNNFVEMREAELIRERVLTATQLDPFIGKYYSSKWVKKNVLRMTDEEIEEMEKEIEEEGSQPVLADGEETSAQATNADAASQAEDNTQESSGTESLTPQLDDAVNKYAFNINKR